MRNGNRALALLERVGFRYGCDVSFATINCRRVQYFSFDRSADAATEIEFHLKVRRRVLVQHDYRSLAAGQLRGIGRCIDSRGLQLRREVGLQQCSAAERACKLETVRDWLQRIVRAERRNRCIEWMRMCRNLFGGCAIRFEERVAG